MGWWVEGRIKEIIAKLNSVEVEVRVRAKDVTCPGGRVGVGWGMGGGWIKQK